MLDANFTAQPPGAPFGAADVERVLDTVRPALALHGGGIELICVDGCNVRVSLRGACIGCPSSLMTLRDSVERHLREELAGFGELIAVEPQPMAGRISSLLKRALVRDPASR